MPSPRSFALIDLYFPAHAATPEQVQEAADRAGLDAVLLVAECQGDLPSPEALAALPGKCRLHPACVVSGAGFRFAIIAPRGFDGFSFDAVEASNDPRTIQAAAHALGGVALPVRPRQSAPTAVERQVAPLPADRVGIVALVAAGSRLGRDLDIEDAGIAERRILGGTGPFGALADLGRLATILPGDPGELASLVGALQRGLGVGVELVAKRPVSARHRRPDPREGREHEAPKEQAQKKRRRRRRGKREGGEGAPPTEASGE
ncbi:MAG: hypothetical protein IT385_13575 [Deltaproteobacteria bacterium]|nr:hypothetical protein [Deltaproteobacteria bacterium]